MFTESALIFIFFIYVLRHRKLIRALVFEPEALNSQPLLYRFIVPGLAIAVLYAVELCVLWWAYGQQDSTAIDWAVVVLLLGVLLAGPTAGIIAAALILPIRAMIMFHSDADEATRAELFNGGWFGLNPDFWRYELWIWWQPGVVQLFAALVLAMLAYQWRQRSSLHDYPMWIGIPLAVGIQAAFLLAAWFQWGAEHALSYFRTEAVPAVLALAVAVMIFVIALAACRSDHERKRSQLAQLDAAQDQLRFLNAQINPHFLNNALSAISGLMQSSPLRARELIGELGDYFRGVCATTDTMVSLEEELAVVKSYVSLEQARYGQRLSVNYKIDAACLKVLVPRLTLQPLVENAIKHAISPNPEGGNIEISASMQDRKLNLEVRDDGTGLMKALKREDFGVGLGNVSARLERLYGENMSFNIDSNWGSGTTAKLSLESKPPEAITSERSIQ